MIINERNMDRWIDFAFYCSIASVLIALIALIIELVKMAA